MRGPQSKLQAKPTVAGCLTKTTKRTTWDLVIVRPCSITPVQENLLDAILGSTTFRKYATSSCQKLVREMVKQSHSSGRGQEPPLRVSRAAFPHRLNHRRLRCRWVHAPPCQRHTPKIRQSALCETGVCSMSQVDKASAAKPPCVAEIPDSIEAHSLLALIWMCAHLLLLRLLFSPSSPLHLLADVRRGLRKYQRTSYRLVGHSWRKPKRSREEQENMVHQV